MANSGWDQLGTTTGAATTSEEGLLELSAIEATASGIAASLMTQISNNSTQIVGSIIAIAQ